ncbi:MAG: carboxypeptidase regulatory-like domain-containing protein, partial [Xenococcaceae cyanobacterium]
QSNNTDYVFGSQSAIWNSPDREDYWGIATIKRFGFTPDFSSSTNGFNVDSRRQPQEINRSLTGEAKPGDVVHLVTRSRQEIVREVVVDDKGIYKFDNIDFRDNDYQILIYPQGRLTIAPEVREPIFSYVSGQLTKRTSTIAASFGVSRDSSADGFLGNFGHLGGGVSYRRGISEQLTLGTGLVVDRSLFALTELFYQPSNIPLRLGISTLIDPQLKDADYYGYFNYQPTKKLSLNFNSRRNSHNLRLNWQVFPQLSLRLSNSDRDNITAGLTFTKSDRNFYLLSTIDYSDRTNFNRRLDLRLYNNWQFFHQGNNENTFSRLSYTYSPSNNLSDSSEHGFFIGYDTSNTENSDNVINLGWQYRSSQNVSDGGSLYDLELGYGFNSRKSAPIASLTTRAIPGTTIRFIYEGVSSTSDDSRVRIDFFPNFRFQGKLGFGDRKAERLRTQGGLLVKPFEDKNNNGQLDDREQIYTEDADLLFTINNKFLKNFNNNINKQGVFVTLDPGEYRLDLDPVGYPFNQKPIGSAYAAKVVAGSYTPLLIPFNPTYTVMGVVTDSQNQPIAGARVKATASRSSNSTLSITNNAGVYFLEDLSPDTYQITVNDRAIDIKPLKIVPNAEPLQEVNIQLVDDARQ